MSTVISVENLSKSYRLGAIGGGTLREDVSRWWAKLRQKTDPNLKFVLKEFPVLGPGSVEAAHVAVAARMQDPTGKKYIEFHQKLLGGHGPADKARALAVAKEVGFDMTRLEKDMDSDEVKATIDEDMKLADALGVSGTPTYVVGDEVVVGAVGLDELKSRLKGQPE